MRTFGKLSFILFVLINLGSTAVFTYFIYLGVIKNLLIVLPVVNLVLMGYIAYKSYMLIHISDHELTVERPFKKERTTYFFNDIQAVSIDNARNDKGAKVLLMTIHKKDNTQDEYNATGLQLERSLLIKELRKRANIL